MGELTIRRNRGFAVPQQQWVGKAEKQSGGVSRRETQAGFTVSETLRQLLSGNGLALSRVRESRRTLQAGEAVLAEVQEKLGRIAELARESAGGDEAGRPALQAELEQLRGELERILSGASAGDAPLFLGEEPDAGAGAAVLLYAAMGGTSGGAEALPDWLLQGIARSGVRPERLLEELGLDGTATGADLLAAVADRPPESDPAGGYLAAMYLGAVIAGGGEPDAGRALEGLGLLLARVAEGVPLDEAVEQLTGGVFTGLADLQSQFTAGTAPGLQDFLTGLLLSGGGASLPEGAPLLSLLAGMEGANLELLMDLLAAGQASAAPEPGAAEASDPLSGAEQLTEPLPGDGAVPSVQLGDVLVTGRDLSGVSFDTSTGVLTVAGEADVALLPAGGGPGVRTLLLMGGGTVTLQGVTVPVLTAGSAGVRVLGAGENTLGEVWLQAGAELALGGSGRIRIGAVRGEPDCLVRLTGGVVEMAGRDGGAPGRLTVPVVLEGPAILAAQADQVRSADGRPLQPVDLIWRTLLPGWSGITALAVDGHEARLALWGERCPSLLRLWLEKGDPSHGYPLHSLVLQGRDAAGHPRTRYTYLHWNQRAGAFRELSLYPNPFTVTGGEQDTDWVYEEGTHTLRILSGRVTAISGGAGTDANQTPFSGRIALADGIGISELTLGGVVCRVSSGRAFSLGRGNDVTLLLESGSENCFESGAGCAGISVGEGTSLQIDCAALPAGSLTASGGPGGAGIGRDSGAGRDQTSRILIRGGVVTASGTGGGAGIGAGRRGAMGPITISGGTVSASGGEGGGAGIGAALGAPVGNISIRGGSVSAEAVHHAAAIGAGVQGESGDILISGTARILKALGGDPGADIGACLFGGCGRVLISGGADIGGARLWKRGGISLQMAEDTVTLPQFRLSPGALQLDGLSVATRERALAAGITVDADRRWVSQIQAAYSALYGQLEQGLSAGAAEEPVRDAASAETLLDGMRRSMLLQSAQAMQAHPGQDGVDVWQLLW